MRQSKKTSDVSHLQAFIDEGFNIKQLADALYSSNSAVSRWLTARAAPAWTLVACEGLRRHKSQYRAIIVTGSEADLKVIRTVADRLAVKVLDLELVR